MYTYIYIYMYINTYMGPTRKNPAPREVVMS